MQSTSMYKMHKPHHVYFQRRSFLWHWRWAKHCISQLLCITG